MIRRLICVGVIVAIATLGTWFIGHWETQQTWENIPVHSTMESLGALASIFLGYFLLYREIDNTHRDLTIVSMGLLSMGILDGFHAFTIPGQGFVLLRSFAAWTGGIGFALAWIEFPSERKTLRIGLPRFIVGSSLVLGIGVLVFRNHLPVRLTEEGVFTPFTIYFNGISQVLYLVGVIWFSVMYLRTGLSEEYLLACLSTLFFLAQMDFQDSRLWGSSWWIWHYARLAASLLALGFLSRQHLHLVLNLRCTIAERDRAEKELRTHRDHLEQLVAERTQALKGSEERLIHLNAVLDAILNVNQMIAQEKNLERLLDHVCEKLVNKHSYSSAWIALLEENRLVRFASSGLDEYPMRLRLCFEQGKMPECARRALSTPGVHCIPVPAEECGDCPLALAYHDRMGIAVRLGDRDENAGVLSVAAPRACAKDIQEKNLLFELAKDITQAMNRIELEAARDRVEEALRKSEERFELAMRGANDGLWDWNLLTGEMYYSPRWKNMLGYEENELENSVSTWETLVHPEDLGFIKNEIAEYLGGKKEKYEVEFRLCHKDGHYVPILSRGFAVLREFDRKPVRFVGTHVDMTVQKTMEDSLRMTAENLRRSNQELELFAYVASHDLQEPLRMVSSYTQLLERRYKDKLDQNARDFIQYAVDGANRMQRLIQDLLTYSRVTTKGKPLESQNSYEAFREALANLQMTIQETGALITHDELPWILGDHTQIVQLFQNLIGNGVKFHRPEEPPQIHACAIRDPENENFWIFRITDHGIGIDPKYFDRLFVIFQRLHTRQEFPGTGIGLALCKRIVQRHGGQIWLESEPDKGTSCFFTLQDAGETKGQRE